MFATFLTIAKPFLFLGWLAIGVGFFAACYSISKPEKNK